MGRPAFFPKEIMIINAQYSGLDPAMEAALQPIKVGDRYETCNPVDLLTDQQIQNIASRYRERYEIAISDDREEFKKQLKDNQQFRDFCLVGLSDQRHIRTLTFDVPDSSAKSFKKSLEAKGLTVL